MDREGNSDAETFFLVSEQLCYILSLAWALLSGFYFLKPRRNEGNFNIMQFFFSPSLVLSAFLNNFSVVIVVVTPPTPSCPLAPNGKIQECESWGQYPSKAQSEADELL